MIAAVMTCFQLSVLRKRIWARPLNFDLLFPALLPTWRPAWNFTANTKENGSIILQASGLLPNLTCFVFLFMGNPGQVGVDLVPRRWLARLLPAKTFGPPHPPGTNSGLANSGRACSVTRVHLR